MSFKFLKLTKGLYCLVDEEDYEILMQFKWQVSHESRGTKWYATRNCPTRGPKIRMHRFIIENILFKEIPKGYVVDHLNHNSLDNRKQNLEVITQTENMRRSPGWKKKKPNTQKVFNKKEANNG